MLFSTIKIKFKQYANDYNKNKQLNFLNINEYNLSIVSQFIVSLFERTVNKVITGFNTFVSSLKKVDIELKAFDVGRS